MDSLQTLTSLWGVYMNGHASHLATKTSRAYGSVMTRLLEKLPARPKGTDIAAWFAAERARVAPAHANYQLRVLQSVVKRAVELDGNGAELMTAVMAVKAPPVPPPVRHMPPGDFVARVMLAARNRGERAWLRLIARGLRKNEMLGLRREDIGVDGAITVCRQRGSNHRKNRVPYVVEVDAETLADLRWTIENRDAIKPEFGRFTGASDGCVFPWSETYLGSFLKHLRESLGADVVGYLPPGKAWHQFRRRMARDAMESGESELMIANRLGDKSTAMARTYSDDGKMRNALPGSKPGPVATVVRVEPPAPARPTDDVITPARVAGHSTLSFSAQVVWSGSERTVQP